MKFHRPAPLFFLSLLATLALPGLSPQARAQFTFASDVASNYSGPGEPGWTNGANAGTGFNSWGITIGGGGGAFVGDPGSAGIDGMTAESFGLFANPTNDGNFVSVDRALESAMQIGDSFSFQWGANFDSGGPGNKGFSLFTGGTTEVLNVNMSNSATITINGLDTGFAYGTNVMTWSFFYSSATTLVVTANDRDGSGSYSNNFTVAAGVDAFRWYASQLVSGDARQPYYNDLLLTNSGLYNVAAAQTEARFLTGSGNLAKTGNGTLTISGATNNFTGTVGITNGAVRLTASSALGAASSVAVQSGAALEYSGGITVNRNATINGTGVSTGGALRNISGNNTHSGTLTLGSASRIVSDAGTLAVSGAVSGSNVGLTVGGAGNTTVQTAIAIGTGRLTKEDAGTLTLTANNSFTGNTLISAGSLVLGNGGTTGAVTGTLTNNGTLIYNRSDSITQSGIISGSGAVTKQGSGTLTLSSANSYSGTTTVSSGAIIASSDTALGTSASGTTVESGATLELSGGITSAENITITGSGVGDGGAIRSLGDGENTLTGTITLGGNARIQAAQSTGTLTTLAVLGTDDFVIVPDFGSINATNYTQTTTTWTMNYSPSVGLNNIASGYLGGESGVDFSAFPNFGLLMSSTSANTLGFTVELFDSLGDIANVYSGSLLGIGTSLMLNPLTLSTPGTGNLNPIVGMAFTWQESGSVNTTLASFVGIPTSGLAISGNISGGANVLTLGAAGAPEGTAGGNISLSGVISGTGGSYGGTTTSLVKDGVGTVTLAASNSFTGDLRIEAGTIAAAATNSLGNGADVFLSTGSLLNVRSSVSVGSVQGAATNATGGIDFTGVFASTGPILNVAGASKGELYLAGDITGVGRLTLSGAGTTLRLSGENIFVGATRIEAGTLVAESAGGKKALGSTASVTVLSGAKLLLNTSEQVFDSAPVTLSGGTIQRGSGVSEVFGALTLNSASFLDYGTGAAGTLSFGNYTPSSLLTIQNFDFGSTLTFGSNLSSSINNTSFFTFENGGIASSSWDSGTGVFTITAIPEPSTYAAAAGLLLLMLWPVRRRLLKDVKSVLGLRAPMRDRLARSRQ
ncbi:MAG: autotransporter-associated beta strand repeat-containing protein [Chthoniobacterales bacterium]